MEKHRTSLQGKSLDWTEYRYWRTVVNKTIIFSFLASCAISLIFYFFFPSLFVFIDAMMFRSWPQSSAVGTAVTSATASWSSASPMLAKCMPCVFLVWRSRSCTSCPCRIFWGSSFWVWLIMVRMQAMDLQTTQIFGELGCHNACHFGDMKLDQLQLQGIQLFQLLLFLARKI